MKAILRLGASLLGLERRREERIDSSSLGKLLLREGALKACRLWLNWRELLRSWIRKWPTSVIHTGTHEILLWDASLHRILEATILLHARIELAKVLWLLLLLLLVLEQLWGLTVEILRVLRSIETSILLLHSYIVQTLAWRSNLLLITSRILHPGGLGLQRWQGESTLLIHGRCRQGSAGRRRNHEIALTLKLWWWSRPLTCNIQTRVHLVHLVEL